MTLITQNDQLQDLCRRLSAGPFITVDTEFLRDRTYWPKLCVLQIAGPEDNDCGVVDVLAPGLDLGPVYELFDDPAIVKVFHAARQDIEIFHIQRGAIPLPLFDTQVAAMVCGFGDSVGYDTLVAKLTGGVIDKSSRFTDWSLRPLSKKQIDYALGDVTYLRKVYLALCDRLEKSGRTAWVDEEMDILRNPGTYEVVPDQAWRRLKSRTNRPKFLAILREVAAWREREAQRRDVPRNRVIRDETLTEIAAHAPTEPNALARTRGFSESLARGRVGAAILEAVQRGLDTPAKEAPVLAAKPDLPKNIGPVIDLLRVLLKMKCAAHDVAQKLVASAADLELLAADDKADIRALHGWRRDLFGEDALAVKHGRLAISINGRRLKLIATKS